MQTASSPEMSRGRFLAVAGGTLAAAGLSGVGAVPAVGANPGSWREKTVSIVPLDNRPVNLYAPAMTADIAGLDPELPPDRLLGHGVYPPDPVTHTVYAPADSDGVGRWLVNQRTDGYVVAISMLTAGGLLASRVGAVVTEADALRRLNHLRRLRSRRPEAPIFAYDMVQRLATEFSGAYEKYNEPIREWAILKDRVENLHQEKYRRRLNELTARIPGEIRADYLRARHRNHEINKAVIRLVAGGVIDFLVLSQDDAALYGLHRPERKELAALIEDLGVEAKVALFSGADEIDTVLVARLANLWAGSRPTVEVEYCGIDGAQWTPPYEVEHYAANIRRHAEASGAASVPDVADIHLLVNTPSKTPDRRDADLDAFIARCVELVDAGRTVAVLDPVFVNRADPELVRRLEERVEIIRLTAYSGWNTAGNALGLCLSHALCRLSWLRGAPAHSARVLRSERAHAEYLLHRFVLDDRWKNRVQPAAYQRARHSGADPEGLLSDQVRRLTAFVRAELSAYTEQFYRRHFQGVRIAGSGTVIEVDDLRSVRIALPWPRLFETALEPELAVHPVRGRTRSLRRTGV